MTNDTSMKKAIFEDFYSHLKTFYCLIATRVTDVSLPEELMREEFIKLAIGSGSAVGMIIDESGVSANLTFNRLPCNVFFPWESIVNIESDYFVFGQKFNPLGESQENKVQEQPINSAIPEKAEIMGDDNWVIKDTKYSHLNLLTRKD